MSVVVLGSINMDLTTYVPCLPVPGETLFGSKFITAPEPAPPCPPVLNS
jgi:ribokinase